MALQLNSFSANGQADTLRVMLFNGTSNQRFRAYPDTIPFPNDAVSNAGNLPSGHVAEFSNLTFSTSNANITLTGGNTTTTTIAAGNIAWFATWNVAANTTGAFICNSVSNSGGNGIAVFSTTTPTSGQLLTLAFSLKINSQG